MRIVEEMVKPERVASGIGGGIDRKKRAEFWWRFSRTAKDLYDSIHGLDRVLVTPQTSNVQGFAFLPVGMVFGHTLIVFPMASWSGFAVLQSRLHQRWAAFLGPTMKDDLRYTPSDCFETFPFPAGVLESSLQAVPEQAKAWTPTTTLETAGRSYYQFRAALMVRNNEGLTKTYNRFHDPHEASLDILKLRELHAAMDRAVLEADGNKELEFGE